MAVTILLYFTAFLTAFLFVIGVYNIIFQKRITVLNRLKLHIDKENIVEMKKKLGERSFKDTFISLMGSLGGMFSRRESYTNKLKKNLTYARIFLRPEEFIGIKVVCSLVLGVLLFLFIGHWFMIIVGLAGGFVFPDLFLTVKKKRRMSKITEQLPEALSIVSSGLRAGLGFYQAMGLVTRDMDSPMKEEFEQVLFENSMGKPTEEVLTNLKERTDNDDLNIFINALIINKQVGGSLAEVLDNIAHTLRERVRIKGEIKTLTTQGRLSAIIICALPIFVGLVIFIINPEYISILFTETIGRVMLFFVAVLMMIGVLFVRRIIDIEV